MLPYLLQAVKIIFYFHGYTSWQLFESNNVREKILVSETRGSNRPNMQRLNQKVTSKSLEKEQIRENITELLQHAATISRAILEIMN